MQKQTRIHEPSYPQSLADFDVRDDRKQTRSDREPHLREPHTGIPSHVLEFTTEWQMVSTAEEV
jgi:hypothetical protein